MTRYQREIEGHLTHNPKTMDSLTRQMYGMSAQELQANLNALSSLMQGSTPTGAELKYVQAVAKSRYNMSAADTNNLLREISALPAHQRAEAYFSGGGRSQADPKVVAMGQQFAREYQQADLSTSLAERMQKRNEQDSVHNDRFANLTADPRVLADTNQRAQMRQSIGAAIGADTSKPSLEQAQRRVALSRLQLADRIDANSRIRAETGVEPSLRESLRDEFDLHKIEVASREVGLPEVRSAAQEDYDRNYGHLEDNYDVTERLGDL